jgi:hypothetical protein
MQENRAILFGVRRFLTIMEKRGNGTGTCIPPEQPNKKSRNELSLYGIQHFRRILNRLEAAQSTSQSGKLEGPGNPYPFRFEPKDSDHSDGAHDENHPVAAFVLRVFFFVVCHIERIQFQDGAKVVFGNEKRSISR